MRTTKIRAKKSWVYYRMSDAKALRILPGLREGLTLHQLGEVPRRFHLYCAAHPEFADEARQLEAANAAKARLRKGDNLRTTTHCRSGLHLMAANNIMIDGTHGRKRCIACRRVRDTHAPIMSSEVAEKVRQALRNGVNLREITTGKPTGGGEIDQSLIITTRSILQRHRRENPDFNQDVTAAMGCRTAPLAVVGTYRYHWNESDLHAVRSLLPDDFPGKDDVVQSVFLALLEGRIGRNQLNQFIRRFVNNYHRQHPTRYAKFGSSPLVSLDEVLFEDGTTTRGDTVSRGLWD